MRKKVLIYGTVLTSIILLGIYYFISLGHHNYYSSICGSGMNGIKFLAIYYLPIILLVIILLLIYQFKQSRKRCKHCNSKISAEFSLCPYCGNSI